MMKITLESTFNRGDRVYTTLTDDVVAIVADVEVDRIGLGETYEIAYYLNWETSGHPNRYKFYAHELYQV